MAGRPGGKEKGLSGRSIDDEMIDLMGNILLMDCMTRRFFWYNVCASWCGYNVLHDNGYTVVQDAVVVRVLGAFGTRQCLRELPCTFL